LFSRPPWNYQLMAGGYLLALVPTLLIGAGSLLFLVQFARKPTAEGILLNGLAWAFFASLFYMAVKSPTYALIKAFYGLLTLLPVCVFGAAGWDFFARRKKFVFFSLSIALVTWA